MSSNWQDHLDSDLSDLDSPTPSRPPSPPPKPSSSSAQSRSKRRSKSTYTTPTARRKRFVRATRVTGSTDESSSEGDEDSEPLPKRNPRAVTPSLSLSEELDGVRKLRSGTIFSGNAAGEEVRGGGEVAGRKTAVSEKRDRQVVDEAAVEVNVQDVPEATIEAELEIPVAVESVKEEISMDLIRIATRVAEGVVASRGMGKATSSIPVEGSTSIVIPGPNLQPQEFATSMYDRTKMRGSLKRKFTEETTTSSSTITLRPQAQPPTKKIKTPTSSIPVTRRLRFQTPSIPVTRRSRSQTPSIHVTRRLRSQTPNFKKPKTKATTKSSSSSQSRKRKVQTPKPPAVVEVEGRFSRSASRVASSTPAPVLVEEEGRFLRSTSKVAWEERGAEPKGISVSAVSRTLPKTSLPRSRSRVNPIFKNTKKKSLILKATPKTALTSRQKIKTTRRKSVPKKTVGPAVPSLPEDGSKVRKDMLQGSPIASTAALTISEPIPISANEKGKARAITPGDEIPQTSFTNWLAPPKILPPNTLPPKNKRSRIIPTVITPQDPSLRLTAPPTTISAPVSNKRVRRKPSPKVLSSAGPGGQVATTSNQNWTQSDYPTSGEAFDAAQSLMSIAPQGFTPSLIVGAAVISPIFKKGARRKAVPKAGKAPTNTNDLSQSWGSVSNGETVNAAHSLMSILSHENWNHGQLQPPPLYPPWGMRYDSASSPPRFIPAPTTSNSSLQITHLVLPPLPPLPPSPIISPRKPKPRFKVKSTATQAPNIPSKKPKPPPQIFTIDKSSWVMPEKLEMVTLNKPILVELGDVESYVGRGKVKEGEIIKGWLEKRVEVEEVGELRRLGKTVLTEMPPIWCLGRQELCEGVSPYFNAFQGGHYDRSGRCYGYLLDGFPSEQDICSDFGKVIISHGGGCADPDLSERYQLRKSQLRTSTRVVALTNCMESQTPVALIAGSSYAFFTWLSEVHIRYVVLGYYMVTAIWAEAEPTAKDPTKFFVRFKVRFEWIPSQGNPWFSHVIGGSAVRLPSSSSLVEEFSSRMNVDNELCPRPLEPAPPTNDDLAPELSRFSHLNLEDSVPSTLAEASILPSSPISPTAPDSNRSPSFSVPETTSSAPTPLGVTSCTTCGQDNKSVFQENIACYNEACVDFFKLNGVVARPSTLYYRYDILLANANQGWSPLVPIQLRPQNIQQIVVRSSSESRGEDETSSTASPSPTPSIAWSSTTSITSSGSDLRLTAFSEAPSTPDMNSPSIPPPPSPPSLTFPLTFETDKWRSYHCTNCGRLSSRQYWSRLVCASCDATVPALPALIAPPPTSLIRPQPAINKLQTTLIKNDTFSGRCYDLPETGARLYHLFPNDTVFADLLFKDYQTLKMSDLLRRNPLIRSRMPGSYLCSNFSVNVGAAYRHVVDVETIPLSDAPRFLTCALAYVTNAARSVIASPSSGDFNELLTVAYLQGGKMNFHDDGEKGLGPVVASVSVGSAADMLFRRKSKNTTQKPRNAANVEPEAKTSGSKSAVVLKLCLKHGDIVIMEGYDVQKLYEHSVVPVVGLRYAATCRFVGNDH